MVCHVRVWCMTYFLLAPLTAMVSGQVRAVTTCELGVLTSSRDTTVKLWVEDGPAAYVLLQTLTGHAKYVGALAYAPPGCLAVAPSGAVVAGGFDGRVLMWDAASGEQLLAMDAHAYQVTGLAVLPDGMLASASVDKYVARGWRVACVRRGGRASHDAARRPFPLFPCSFKPAAAAVVLRPWMSSPAPPRGCTRSISPSSRVSCMCACAGASSCGAVAKLLGS